MNRLALMFGLFVLLLSACAPQPLVETNVVPTLFSASVRDDTVLLQGRYFGDGRSGENAESYVVLGADYAGNGGVRAEVLSWGNNRIVVSVPAGAGYGYAYVYVDGIRSTGLPVNLD